MTMTMPAEPWTLPLWAGDLSEIVDAALAQLRIDPADVDSSRMEPYAAAAVRRIDTFLDPEGTEDFPFPPPPELFEASVTVTIRLFRQKDAPFGVTGGYSDFDTGPVRIPADVLQGVYSLIRPLKRQYGLA